MGSGREANVIKKLGEGKGGMQEEEEGIERNGKENRTRSKTVEIQWKNEYMEKEKNKEGKIVIVKNKM